MGAEPIDALALVTQWRLMSQLVQGMEECPCFFPIFRTLEAGIQKKICPEKLKLTRVKCRIFTFAAVDLLFGCFFRLLVGWKLWFWHSSGSDSLCFGGTFDKFCRTIGFLSYVRIIRHHRHQMMFFFLLGASTQRWLLPCLFKVNKVWDKCRNDSTCNSFGNVEVPLTADSGKARGWFGATNGRCQQLTFGSWLKDVGRKFFPRKWVFFGLVKGWKFY